MLFPLSRRTLLGAACVFVVTFLFILSKPPASVTRHIPILDKTYKQDHQHEQSCSTGESDGQPGGRMQCIVDIPSYESLYLAQPVSPTFVGFAFEEAAFYTYAGPANDPNVFSQNLINEVTKRANAPPSIRVGGTSLDNAQYNPRQRQALKLPQSQMYKNRPKHQRYGPAYFRSFGNFPDAQYVLTVPVAKRDQEMMLEFAGDGYETISELATVESISVGNEPNLYPGRSRPDDYSLADWVEEFINHTTALCDELGFPYDEPLFDAEGLAVELKAGGAAYVMNAWSQPKLFHAGLDDVIDRLKSVSVHYYQFKVDPEDPDPNYTLKTSLMSHDIMVQNMSYYKDAINYLREKDIPLNLAEVGSAINPHSEGPSWEAFLGAALWQVDFLLYCMSIGINRVNMQQGMGYPYSMWLPDDWNGMPASVRAPYYAHVFAADLIAPANPKPKARPDEPGTLQVFHMGLGQDLLGAYACYDGGELTKIAVVNYMWWTPGPEGPKGRPTLPFTFTLPPESTASSFAVKRLTSPGGTTANNSEQIFWAGLSWNYANMGLPTTRRGYNEKTAVVLDGKVKVNVGASEAVMLVRND